MYRISETAHVPVHLGCRGATAREMGINPDYTQDFWAIILAFILFISDCGGGRNAAHNHRWEDEDKPGGKNGGEIEQNEVCKAQIHRHIVQIV